ncbi:hypothetical protein V6N13_013751 [Hibiscus sabdariffa]|uniref:Gelsolin-like domain-containing protein n=2 Tax=Hibiscus sabdariffa TaxID=183260 RepID=A0ABR2BW38_9ROSI
MSSPCYSSGVASDFEAASKSAIVSAGGSGVQVTTFTELVDEVTLHFQIIRLAKQIYVWIGSDSAKLGNLYAAAPTRPANAEKKLIEKLITMGYSRPKSRFPGPELSSS